MTIESVKVSARERLLRAADELFYEEGIHTVGIDRVIERAGVAKATLYSAFGSKDELVRVYLRERHLHNQERMERLLNERFETARERLTGIFEIEGENFVPGFKGCAFMTASAESSPGSFVQDESDEFRAWLLALFVGLAREAGARDPETLGRQLHLLYDGASIAAWMDRDASVSTPAQRAARLLVDETLGG
ncbi:MAG TPA: TetR/AcrR family transcriptional regulator [Acidimicrobiales bacterium]|nr:TetR/AcrR family transcriptional regulator [Acidimicrobiales bacterium]